MVMCGWCLEKMGAVCYVCDVCPVISAPRPAASKHILLYTHTRIHTPAPVHARKGGWRWALL